MSIVGRFGYDDDGQTPNTQITIFDYDVVPIIYAVRGLPIKEGNSNMDIYNAISSSGIIIKSVPLSPSPNNGVVVQCQDCYVDLTDLIDFINNGKQIQRFNSISPWPQACFINAIRSRKINDIRINILEGHLSTALCHMGNISYRIGKESSSEKIREVVQGDKDSIEAFERLQNYLCANGISLKNTSAALGPCLNLSYKKGKVLW